MQVQDLVVHADLNFSLIYSKVYQHFSKKKFPKILFLLTARIWFNGHADLKSGKKMHLHSK